MKAEMTQCILQQQQQHPMPGTTMMHLGDVQSLYHSCGTNYERFSYTTLDSPRKSAGDITADIDNIDMDSWRKRHTRHWSSDDLLSFIYSIAEEHSDVINPLNVSGEEFRDLSGGDLYRMKAEDFICRDPVHGQLIHDCLKKRMSLDNSVPPAYCPPLPSATAAQSQTMSYGVDDVWHQVRDEISYQCYPMQQSRLPKPVEDCIDQDTDDDTSRDNITGWRGESDIVRYCYDDDAKNDGPYMVVPVAATAAVTSFSSSQNDEIQRHHILQPISIHSNGWTGLSNSEYVELAPHMFSESNLATTSVYDVHHAVHTYPDLPQSSTYHHRRHFEPSSLVPLSCHQQQRLPMDDVTSSSTARPRKMRTYTRRNAPTNHGQVRSARPLARTTVTAHGTELKKPKTASGKGGHLWEFLRDLLKSSCSTSGSSCHDALSTPAGGERIIQWEDRVEGVFRIVDSKEVAKLWGEQKDNRKTKMTYEKLSRALRWCRDEHFLAKVPKDRGFPKKLCFMFGKKSSNWQN